MTWGDFLIAKWRIRNCNLLMDFTDYQSPRDKSGVVEILHRNDGMDKFGWECHVQFGDVFIHLSFKTSLTQPHKMWTCKYHMVTSRLSQACKRLVGWAIGGGGCLPLLLSIRVLKLFPGQDASPLQITPPSPLSIYTPRLRETTWSKFFNQRSNAMTWWSPWDLKPYNAITIPPCLHTLRLSN